MRNLRLQLAVFGLFTLLFRVGVAQDTTDLYPSNKGSLVCWTESCTSPRPLKIHFLKVDLTDGLEVFTLPGEDPDGNGPAESTLTIPGDLLSRYHALAAVNANAFAGMPGTENDIRGWYRNRPVDIQGMVVSDGKVISPAQTGRTPFWLDSKQHPHIGNPSEKEVPWQAVSDWSGPLILGGRVVPDSTVKTLHPRTAIGFDESGKWLLILVADGRQPGYSEGISLYEIAILLRSKGCTESLNLDGGGSSIMMYAETGGQVHIVNSPSGIFHRPVPVMLGIRKAG
jgi:hypothetical protein